MRSGWRTTIRAIAVTAIGLGVAAYSFGQSGTTDEGKRKVKTKVLPAYPELAKRMSVTGKVKIEVVITPDGHVKSTRVIGASFAGAGVPGRSKGMEVHARSTRDDTDRGI